MLLTISTTHRPATDLGYLLVKHPDRMHTVQTSVGAAHVVFGEATPERCTAALVLEVDAARLVKRGGPGAAFALSGYVNDRPYAASSLLTVAMARVFASALRGVSRDRPELAGTPIPLRLGVPALRCPPELVERVFAPLGWRVRTRPVPAVPADWGDSPYLAVTLHGTLRLADALNHLYVALSALDGDKHYWITDDEVDKLLRAGAGWLATHPDRELITNRYLARRRGLAREALRRLAEPEEAGDDADGCGPDDARLPAERAVPLAARRREAVRVALAESGARRVLDLGCGHGDLLVELARDASLSEVVGADVSSAALATAERRVERLADRQRERVRLLQTALTYTDARLAGYDAAVLAEVVEHVDPPRLPALARAVFGAARPGTVLVTTPNAEYNVRYPGLTGGALRHRDHRFEWTRVQFGRWADRVADDYGYTVELRPVGEPDPRVGAPCQLAIFHRGREAA